jgi:hypothetical protein
MKAQEITSSHSIKSSISTNSLASKISTRSELAGKIVKRNQLLASSGLIKFDDKESDKPATRELNKRVDLMMAKEREK